MLTNQNSAISISPIKCHENVNTVKVDLIYPMSIITDNSVLICFGCNSFDQGPYQITPFFSINNPRGGGGGGGGG